MSKWDSDWVPKTPKYSDGSGYVSTGDAIRFKQAPGGILPSSQEWVYGTVVESANSSISTHVIQSGATRYNLLGHVIERDLSADNFIKLLNSF